ncbi:hypothetical protein B0I37DRAFT_159157 [Chaetomium sp. MPI-CAGE-AT-0009]|nr:hypothetical protein B0I37DRAFT_159157 [Chaetomium sp. MPI-CAGE-AT-0009]
MKLIETIVFANIYSLAAALSVDTTLTKRSPCAATESRVACRSGPRNTSSIVGIISKGIVYMPECRVPVGDAVEEDRTWFKINLKGKDCYVPAAYMGPICSDYVPRRCPLP